MAFKDDLLLVLSGGIPALVDGPGRAGDGTQATTNEGLPRTVEQTPPEPQVRDREPFRLNGMTNGQQNTLLLGGAILAAVIAFAVLRR